MKRRLLLWLLILALLSVSGCRSSETPAENTIDIYRMVRVEQQKNGELLRPEIYRINPGEDPLHCMLSALASPSANPELVNPLPQGTQLLSYALTDGQLRLDVSPEYLELEGISKTIVDYCLTLTLCRLDEVQSVSIFVDGTVVSAGLQAEDVRLYDSEISPHEKQIRLYFSDAENRYLIAEYHTLTVSDDTMIERYVLEELLRGPHDSELAAVIPLGTQLLSVSSADGLCIVDLSSEFLTNRPETAARQRLALYAIVNSLTALSEIRQVKLTVEGESLTQYGWYTLDEYLLRNENAIGPVNSGKGERDTDLYILTANGQRAVPIPRIIVPDTYYSLEESLTRTLLGALTEPGFMDPFPNNDAPITVETRNGICYVNLPSSVFVDLPIDTRNASVQALVATLTQLNTVNAVTISIDGSVFLENQTPNPSYVIR